MKRARAMSPLRHRGFRMLVAGQMASNLGDAFYGVALPWYVLAGHGSAVLLGTVLAAYGVPRTVLMAIGGHASDRWRPWTVMMACDSVRAAAVAALAVAAASGPARPALLVPVAVVLGAGEGMFLPGGMSVIPTLLPDEELQAGNSLSTAGGQLSFLVGPAIGGGFVALAGSSAAFGADAVSFVVSAVTLAGIRAHQTSAAPEPEQRRGPVTAPGQEEMLPGDAAAERLSLSALLRSERALQVTIIVVIAANLGSGGMTNVALPALAHGPFHAGATGYGALLAAISAGSLLGTLVAGQLHSLRRPAVAASAAFLAGAAFVAVSPYLGSAWAAGSTLAIGFAFYSLGNLVFITVMQRWAPPHLLGRVMGAVLTAAVGAYPVSVAVGGVLVRDFGPAPLFPAAAGILVVAVLGGLTQRKWRDFPAAGPVAPTALVSPEPVGPFPPDCDNAPEASHQ